MENKLEPCCCSCEHNIRSNTGNGDVECNCDIDGHYIGYVECFEDCCTNWKEVDNGKID